MSEVSFQNITEALKKVYSPKVLTGMVRNTSPFRKAIYEGVVGASGTGTMVEHQVISLVDPDPSPDVIEALGDVIWGKGGGVDRLNAWRSGTLGKYEARHTTHREAHQRQGLKGQADDPAAQ